MCCLSVAMCCLSGTVIYIIKIFIVFTLKPAKLLPKMHIKVFYRSNLHIKCTDLIEKNDCIKVALNKKYLLHTDRETIMTRLLHIVKHRSRHPHIVEQTDSSTGTSHIVKQTDSSAVTSHIEKQTDSSAATHTKQNRPTVVQ